MKIFQKAIAKITQLTVGAEIIDWEKLAELSFLKEIEKCEDLRTLQVIEEKKENRVRTARGIKRALERCRDEKSFRKFLDAFKKSVSEVRGVESEDSLEIILQRKKESLKDVG